MAAEQCATPERECPWGPKEFQENGRMLAVVQATAAEVVDMRVEHKVMARDVADIRTMLAGSGLAPPAGMQKKNLAVSAGAGAFMAGAVLAAWEYLRTKFM